MAKLKPDWPFYQLRNLKSRRAHADQRKSSSTLAIDQELKSPSEHHFGVLRHRLTSLSISTGTFAVIASSSGNSDAWQLLNRSLQYNLASFQVAAAMGFPRAGWCDANHACLLLATAITLQSRPVATWLAKLITGHYAAGGPLRDWEVSPFEPLMVHLAGGVEGGRPLRVAPSEYLPGFYDGLVEAESAQDAQRELNRLVVERVRLVSPSFADYPPFEWSPFDLFPVDLLAILMVNHSGIPRFDFGPLGSPLCDPPLPFPFEPDPLARRVLDRVAEQHDVADVSW